MEEEEEEEEKEEEKEEDEKKKKKKKKKEEEEEEEEDKKEEEEEEKKKKTKEEEKTNKKMLSPSSVSWLVGFECSRYKRWQSGTTRQDSVRPKFGLSPKTFSESDKYRFLCNVSNCIFLRLGCLPYS